MFSRCYKFKLNAYMWFESIEYACLHIYWKEEGCIWSEKPTSYDIVISYSVFLLNDKFLERSILKKILVLVEIMNLFINNFETNIVFCRFFSLSSDMHYVTKEFSSLKIEQNSWDTVRLKSRVSFWALLFLNHSRQQ